MIGTIQRYVPRFLILIAAFMPFSSLAQHIGLVGLFPTKALISIDGGTPKTIALGTTLNGIIKLIAIQNNQATLEVEGKPRVLALGQNLIIKTPNNSQTATVTVTADSYGQFRTTAQINGVNFRFLIDTGASHMLISQEVAQRLGLNLSHGKTVYFKTAKNQLRAIVIKLDTVSLKGIVLHNVEAYVVDKKRSHMLIGMSFLKHMEIDSDGQTMTIKKKY